jgi:hypothetical protein
MSRADEQSFSYCDILQPQFKDYGGGSRESVVETASGLTQELCQKAGFYLDLWLANQRFLVKSGKLARKSCFCLQELTPYNILGMLGKYSQDP